MDIRGIDPKELGACMRLALDIVMAHRIARGLTLERGRITAIREVLEERVLLALQETDESAMPLNWSWQQAAEQLSTQIALAIVHEQKNEPPAPHEGPSALGDP